MGRAQQAVRTGGECVAHTGLQVGGGGDVLLAALKEAGEVAAQRGIGGVVEPQFAQATRAAPSREIRGRGERQKAVECDGFKQWAFESGRNGVGKKPGAARGYGDGNAGQSGVVKERFFGVTRGLHEGEKLPLIHRMAGVSELGPQRMGKGQIEVIAAK